ncbi:hypothetical protein [uncultured Desulfovibrio sp.]|uniref:hypothetical protein n=1 Tax=uncultured Desulfovibrio sp. TaxID=167968 RepID=UPI00261B1E0C|nr:hypothetical protein [uncultured Desulfovibrio sp.]
MAQAADAATHQNFVQEALDNFAVLLDDTDFTAHLHLMGVGRLHFTRRKQLLLEWRGLYVALWRLALGRSFPQDADAMLEAFRRSYRERHRDKQTPLMLERAEQYWDMMRVTKESDFTEVARHFCSFCQMTEKDTRSLQLKLVLIIRKAYTDIFRRLI